MSKLAFAKPERIGKQKRRAKRQRKVSRAQCRAIVMRREKNRCQRCGRTVTDDCWPWQDERAQVNEEVPRSLGGNPRDPDACTLLCLPCHMPGGQHAPTAARMRTIQQRLKKAG